MQQISQQYCLLRITFSALWQEKLAKDPEIVFAYLLLFFICCWWHGAFFACSALSILIFIHECSLAMRTFLFTTIFSAKIIVNSFYFHLHHSRSFSQFLFHCAIKFCFFSMWSEANVFIVNNILTANILVDKLCLEKLQNNWLKIWFI